MLDLFIDIRSEVELSYLLHGPIHISTLSLSLFELLHHTYI